MTLLSVDVSEYNGVINWPVASSVIELAGVKATGTYKSSPGDVDPQFRRNWAALKSYPDITRMAYHFWYANQGAPADQAKLFLDTVQPGPDDILALDLEEMETAEVRRLKGSTELQKIVKTWLDTVEGETKHKAYIYTSPGWWNEYACTVKLWKRYAPAWTAEYPLWVAGYTTALSPSMPVGWDVWTMWQYDSNHVKVPGVGVSVGSNPYCDLNRLAMPAQVLRKLWNPAPVVIPPGEPTDAEKLKILWGEYLEQHPA